MTLLLLSRLPFMLCGPGWCAAAAPAFPAPCNRPRTPASHMHRRHRFARRPARAVALPAGRCGVGGSVCPRQQLAVAHSLRRTALCQRSGCVCVLWLGQRRGGLAAGFFPLIRLCTG